MIHTKADLAYYLEEDRKANHKPILSSWKHRLSAWLFPDYNYEFMVCLRHLEYYVNGGGKKWLRKFFLTYYHRRHAHLRAITGIELNPNVAGPGLHLSHGKVVVSAIAHIGAGCKILSDVTIGGQGRYDRSGAPSIGNRVFIASGAKIIGDIRIADDVVIGANAVVTKDITEPNTTWGGIPARKISDTGSYHYLNRT